MNNCKSPLLFFVDKKCCTNFTVFLPDPDPVEIFRIRHSQNVPDPTGSGSTILLSPLLSACSLFSATRPHSSAVYISLLCSPLLSTFLCFALLCCLHFSALLSSAVYISLLCSPLLSTFLCFALFTLHIILICFSSFGTHPHPYAFPKLLFLCWYTSQIHERTVSLRFLRINWTVLRLEVSLWIS
jgi:hypothetical protein